jgi:hypothetical protein
MIYMMLVVMEICFLGLLECSAQFEDLVVKKSRNKLNEWIESLNYPLLLMLGGIIFTCDNAGNKKSKNFKTSFFAVPTPT